MGLFSRLRRKGSVTKGSTGLLSPEPDVAPKKLNIKIARLQSKYFADGSAAAVSVASTYGELLQSGLQQFFCQFPRPTSPHNRGRRTTSLHRA
jgi:hypothetical protein